MSDPRIASHIRAVATRSPTDGDELVRVLMRRAWPMGDDGTDAVSREWLRRWSPASVAITPDCSCAAGRCAWCN